MTRSKLTPANMPVMASKCLTCPFKDDGDKRLANEVIERTLLSASQICHHPVLHGKRETHLCRGARDVQLSLFARLGWIEAPTDAAFAARCEQLHIKTYGVSVG